MYQSPIELIYDDLMDNVTQTIVKETGEIVYQRVLNTGVNVDKDELIKALQYDRNQYDRGYADGRNDATAHADWVGVSPEVDTITCSRCGIEWGSCEMATPYCPECGARMDNYKEMIEIGLPSFEVVKGDSNEDSVQEEPYGLTLKEMDAVSAYMKFLEKGLDQCLDTE